MDALILSCSTGGGHNAAGAAIREELERRGHRVTMLDPYALTGTGLERRVGNSYIRIAQKTPRFFGFVYGLGNLYRRLPVRSPVYHVNAGMCAPMRKFLLENHFDVILMPHLYPGEILTNLKRRGFPIPKTIFVATDYSCIPFTEEIECDCYITPSPELCADFIRRGIAPEKLVPAGIPVRASFSKNISRDEAVAQLSLDMEKRYLLLSGGSIGAGGLSKVIALLSDWLAGHENYHLIAICGNNRALYAKLQQQYGINSNITLLTSTDKMALYMKACDAFLSKPGGLSSTEAAVSETPLIHISPIPGCETRNLAFFDQNGMSLAVGNRIENLPAALDLIADAAFVEQMRRNQRRAIPRSAAEAICNLAESITIHEGIA